MVRTESTDASPISSANYESITQHAALVDRSNVGRLRVSGGDAADLLNRLTTNNLENLTREKGMGTVLTTNKGRIVDMLSVIPTGESLLVLTSPGRQQQVADWIEFYTFIEDVTVENITDDNAMLAICGPDAADAIRRTLDVNIDHIDLLSPVEGGALDDATLVRTDHFNLPTFELIVNREAKERAIALFKQRGFDLVSDAAAEHFRIAMGVPSANGELTEDFNPLEAGLRPLISFNKICYIGQEVVARLNAYEKVQKHLVMLEWKDGNVAAVPGASLSVGDKVVGTLTSVGPPCQDKGLALGYVRKAYVELGTSLVSETDEGAVTLRVTGLSGAG